jgi:hypothetical protein
VEKTGLFEVIGLFDVMGLFAAMMVGGCGAVISGEEMPFAFVGVEEKSAGAG